MKNIIPGKRTTSDLNIRTIRKNGKIMSLQKNLTINPMQLQHISPKSL